MTTDPATLAPGTLVEATVRGVPGVRCMAYREPIGGAKRWVGARSIRGYLSHRHEHLADVRPVRLADEAELVRPGCVQLDLSDEEAVASRLVALVQRSDRVTLTGRMRDALRALRDDQAKPAEVPEPTGLGAVVRDARGKFHVLAEFRDDCRNWRTTDAAHWLTFVQVQHFYGPVEVLSHGVNGDGSEVEVP